MTAIALGGDVDIDHILGVGAAGETEALSLTDRDHFNGVDLPTCSPERSTTAPVQRNALTKERRSAVLVGDEADILALGLLGGSQVEVHSEATDVRLGEFTDRQQHPSENGLLDDVQDV